MGCNCYDDKKSDNGRNKIIINKALTKTKNNINTPKKQETDKISSLSSFISDISINNLEKTGEKKKGKIKTFLNNNPKNNIESIEDYSIKNSFLQTPHAFEFKNKENKYESGNISNKEYTCKITEVNYNTNENKKYIFKHGQITPLYNLIDLIKKETDFKDINKNIFLFYKGNKVKNNDTIYSIINKKESSYENIYNNNVANKPKETNEINFDMISISEDEEENANDDSIIKKESNSFSSNESENERIEKLKIEKIKKQNNDKEKKISKKLLYKLSPLCKKHKQENLIYICLTCFTSFCPLEFKEHKKEFKDHEIIPKNKLIDLNYDIKRIKLNLTDKYKEFIPDLYTGECIQTFGENENDKNKLKYVSSNDLFSKLKIDINDINEEMENLYNSYKQSYNKINSKFLSIYEEKMPKIIEFDEYIDKKLLNFENMNIFSNENIFIDNYNNFINIKKNSNKYYQNIIELKDIIFKYKEFLELFKEKGKELIDYIKKGIENIMKFKNGDKMFNLNGAFLQLNEKADIMNRNNNNKNINNNNNNIYNNNINKNNNNNVTNNFTSNKNIIKSLNNVSLTTNKDYKQVINLKFLFSDKKNKLSRSVINRNLNNNTNISNGCSSFIKNKNYNYFSIKESKDKLSNLIMDKFSNKNVIKDYNNKENKSDEKFEKEKIIKPNEMILKSPSNISSKGNFNFDFNSPLKPSSNISLNKENDLTQNSICSLLYGTKNIIQYLPKNKKLNILTPDITFLKIKKFESYISFINYKNTFYISGGYSTSKQFFEYDIDSNNFVKLPEMLSNHYYHTMIGNNNYIYSVSGFKSKKIEKYNIITKKWDSLPDLFYERAYPNVFIYNNNIFVFGKINNFNDEENTNIIEYFNIEDDNYNDHIWNQIKLNIKFPFNSGMIISNNNNILLVGGKMDLNENSIDMCYDMKINLIENKYDIDIKLSNIKLNQTDEFNGNIFCCIDQEGINYGLFSSLNPNLLCIFNKKTNKFTYVKSDSNNNNMNNIINKDL